MFSRATYGFGFVLWFASWYLPGWSQERAPILVFRFTNGQEHKLSEYQGKVVILNFWATWCVPCQHEMPLLAAAQKHYGDRGIVVIGASVDDEKTREKVGPFATKYKINFLLMLTANTENMKALGLGEIIPATAFVDKDGRVATRVLGELSKSDLNHRIEWMLGNRRGKGPPALVNNLGK